VRIPARPSSPLFSGEEGKERTEIYFDPVSKTVSLKMLVQDRQGYFIPDLHSSNFVVYEDGVRQPATVNAEHAPATLILLMEHGGRTPALDRLLDIDIGVAATKLLDLLGNGDRIQVLGYNNGVQTLVDFTSDISKAEATINTLPPPTLSELTLYDAVLSTLKEAGSIQGRKAIILISSGRDTFSKASYEDVLNAVTTSDTPIYVLDLARYLHDLADLEESAGPATHFDWRTADSRLLEIGRESGARTYAISDTVNLTATYDDLLENLKLRYVITYQSTSNKPLDSPRSIRIELVDPKTGGPLRIVDSRGQLVKVRLLFQDTYIPARVATSGNTQPKRRHLLKKL
jgi:VWFA-related protein